MTLRCPDISLSTYTEYFFQNKDDVSNSWGGGEVYSNFLQKSSSKQREMSRKNIHHQDLDYASRSVYIVLYNVPYKT